MVDQSFQAILDAHTFLVQLRYEHWIQHEAYTPIWWILLCTWILSWVIFYFMVDRRQLVEISLYGVQIFFVTTLLDAIGSVQGLWIYPIKIIPYTPHLESIDWGILPLTYMLIYQYFPKWKGFILAQIIVATVYSFVGEPFLAKFLGNYVPLHWKSIFSFPIYLILAIVPRVTTKSIFNTEKRARSK